MVNTVLALSLLPTPGMVSHVFGQEPPVSTFRSSIDVVSVSAVVRDRKGRFVENLERKDFIVAEAGQPRPILDFRAQADGPVKLAMLFDISGSMRVGPKAVDARQAPRLIEAGRRGSALQFRHQAGSGDAVYVRSRHARCRTGSRAVAVWTDLDVRCDR